MPEFQEFQEFLAWRHEVVAEEIPVSGGGCWGGDARGGFQGVRPGGKPCNFPAVQVLEEMLRKWLERLLGGWSWANYIGEAVSKVN